MPDDTRAYVTLVTNADYGLGALALARSLRLAGSSVPLVVLATDGAGGLDTLAAEGCRIVETRKPGLSDGFVRRHSRESQHRDAPFTKGEKPAFHDPLDNFCKLRLWQMTGYDKLVFIDADAIVLRNTDRLFDYPAFVAAPNVYESIADFGRMNAGVFVAEPSSAVYDAMLESLDEPGRFWPRTDQTFLQHFFPDWHGLPYTYNVLQYVYFNLPALWHWPALKILHYQYEKPWQPDHGRRDLLQPLIDLWHGVLEGKPVPDDLPAPQAARSVEPRG